MSYDLKTARRYRGHAARLRRMAIDEDPGTRKTLMELAQDYERMAQAHERIEVNNINNVVFLNARTANRKR